jgi:universal stress protein A
MKPKKPAHPSPSTGAEGPLELMPSVFEVRNVLVPVDFSEPSRQAVRCAMHFAQRFDSKLTLLHVVEPVGTPDFEAFPLAAGPEKVERSVKAQIHQLCKKEGLQAPLLQDVQVRQGRAYNEIVEAARSLKIHLIIIATSGRTGLAHVLLGSTAERVVRYAPCPVLVVRQTSCSAK